MQVIILDDLDKKIIDLLSQNARMPVKDIAQQVSLTSPAVSSRIRRMEQDGLIAGYTVRLHLSNQINWVDALISVSIQPHQQEIFLEMLNRHPQVVQCFHVTGSHSYIAKVQCESMQVLEHLITSFQKLGATSTQIILSTVIDRRPPSF